MLRPKEYIRQGCWVEEIRNPYVPRLLIEYDYVQDIYTLDDNHYYGNHELKACDTILYWQIIEPQLITKIGQHNTKAVYDLALAGKLSTVHKLQWYLRRYYILNKFNDINLL